jgi:hypothetical protein
VLTVDSVAPSTCNASGMTSHGCTSGALHVTSGAVVATYWMRVGGSQTWLLMSPALALELLSDFNRFSFPSPQTLLFSTFSSAFRTRRLRTPTSLQPPLSGRFCRIPNIPPVWTPLALLFATRPPATAESHPQLGRSGTSRRLQLSHDLIDRQHEALDQCSPEGYGCQPLYGHR